MQCGGMLYADDACIVSRPTRGSEMVMAVIVEVFGALGLTTFQEKGGDHTRADPMYTGNGDRLQHCGQECL